MKLSLRLAIALILAVGTMSAGCAATDDGPSYSSDGHSGSSDNGRVRPDANGADRGTSTDTDFDTDPGDTDRPDLGSEDVPGVDTQVDYRVADQTDPVDTGSEDIPVHDISDPDLPPSDPGIDLGTPQVVFDLRDRALSFDEGLIEDIDEQISFTITLGGVSMTMTANQGVLNQTSSGFGVNSDGAGDDTDGLDGSLGEERISVAFTGAVVFRGVEVSGFSGDDAAGIVIADGSPASIAERGFFSTHAAALAAGQTVQIYWVAGNGISLDAIAVDPE